MSPTTTSNPRSDVATEPARRHRLSAVAGLILGALALVACGEDVQAPAPGEASTGVPLNVGSEEPVATASESTSP